MMCNNRESDARRPRAGTRNRRDPHSTRAVMDADDTCLLLEQKRSLEQLNTWFEVALNNMVRGLSMFDAEQRLIVCNKSYRQTLLAARGADRPRHAVDGNSSLSPAAGNRPRRRRRRGQVLQVARRTYCQAGRGAVILAGTAPAQRSYAARHLSAASRRRMGGYPGGHHRKATRPRKRSSGWRITMR